MTKSTASVKGPAPAIRKARVGEVPEIRRLLLEFAGQKEWNVLPRKMADLYSLLRDYYVCREEEGPLLGIAALHIFWEDLAEIRSLVVVPESQRRGLGSRLMDTCLEEARLLGLKRVFVLTSEAGFFERFGFKEVPRGELPVIVWAECTDCVKFPDCDEFPMMLDLWS